MKIIRIPEPTTWRPDARTLLHFGTYRVPEDISADMAAQAVSEGVAVVVEDATEVIEARKKRPAK